MESVQDTATHSIVSKYLIWGYQPTNSHSIQVLSYCSLQLPLIVWQIMIIFNCYLVGLKLPTPHYLSWGGWMGVTNYGQTSKIWTDPVKYEFSSD